MRQTVDAGRRDAGSLEGAQPAHRSRSPRGLASSRPLRSVVQALVVALPLLLAACAAHVNDDVLASGDLKASGKGVVVFDTSPMDPKCDVVGIVLGTYSSEYQLWVESKTIIARDFGTTVSGEIATERVLPAGQYGINVIICKTAAIRLVMRAGPYQGGLPFGPRFSGVPRPLAIFNVGAGEVVDIGSIGTLKTGTYSFAPLFAPMTPAVRAAFVAAKPKLAAAMVSRPLVRLTPETQPLAPNSPKVVQ